MNISRSQLVRMVAEEVQRALYEFSHEENEAKKKKGGRPETKDASDEPSKKSKSKDDKPAKQAPPPGDAAADADEEPVEDPVAMGDGEYDTDDEGLPGDDEMAADNADASSDEEDALDDEGDAGTEGEGQVAEQVRGRMIDDIRQEPESELLAGAREIVLTFSDSPDILRICVDGVGNIKYFLNGKDYDLP